MTGSLFPTAVTAAAVFNISRVERCARLGKLHKLGIDTETGETRPAALPPTTLPLSTPPPTTLPPTTLPPIRLPLPIPQLPPTPLPLGMGVETVVVTLDSPGPGPTKPGSLFRFISKGEISKSRLSRLCAWKGALVADVALEEEEEDGDGDRSSETVDEPSGSCFTRAGGGGKLPTVGVMPSPLQ